MAGDFIILGRLFGKGKVDRADIRDTTTGYPKKDIVKEIATAGHDPIKKLEHQYFVDRLRDIAGLDGNEYLGGSRSDSYFLGLGRTLGIHSKGRRVNTQGGIEEVVIGADIEIERWLRSYPLSEFDRDVKRYGTTPQLREEATQMFRRANQESRPLVARFYLFSDGKIIHSIERRGAASCQMQVEPDQTQEAEQVLGNVSLIEYRNSDVNPWRMDLTMAPQAIVALVGEDGSVITGMSPIHWYTLGTNSRMLEQLAIK